MEDEKDVMKMVGEILDDLGMTEEAPEKDVWTGFWEGFSSAVQQGSDSLEKAGAEKHVAKVLSRNIALLSMVKSVNEYFGAESKNAKD